LNQSDDMMITPSTVTTHQEARQRLRQALRATRRALTPEQQADHALRAAEYLLAAYPWKAGVKVSISLAFDGELSLAPAVSLLQARGVEVFLPVIQEDKKLLFAPYLVEDTLLTPNRFGIDEPAYLSGFWTATQLSVMILPLVGFDHQGNRLGMGGGYYDRTLAQEACVHRPYLIGMAHACQAVNKVPTETWDIPLNCLITEEGICYCEARERDCRSCDNK
jgi:5-formyltetrahydrofolate cyclo-ligase